MELQSYIELVLEGSIPRKRFLENSLRKRVGLAAEDQVSAAVVKHLSWKVLHRNLQTPFGEMDIVFQDKRLRLHFLEVKFRRSLEYSEEFVWGSSQRRRFSKSIRWFAQKKGVDIDLVCPWFAWTDGEFCRMFRVDPSENRLWSSI